MSQQHMDDENLVHNSGNHQEENSKTTDLVVVQDCNGNTPVMTNFQGEEGQNNAPSPSSFSEQWSRVIQGVQAPILVGMQALTQTVAYNPKRTLFGVTFLSVLLLVIGLFTNFNVDVDEDILWTPANSLPIQHSDWIDDQSNFPQDTLDFVLFFHSHGQNVLGQGQVQQVFDALDAILSLPGYEAMCADSTYVDTTTNQTTCEIDGLVQFWNLDSQQFATQVSSDEETIQALSSSTFPDGTKVSPNAIFGQAQRDETTDLLTSCQGYTVVIRFPDTDAAESLEDDALDRILDLRQQWNDDSTKRLKLEVTADGSFSDEFERAILKDIPLIPIVFVIMSVFTAIIFFKRDKVQSRSLLGFGAVLAVLLSLLSGFGLLFMIGTPFTSMTQILPFVIFGVGLDDAFIIFGSYARTNPKTKTEDRIGETIDDIGISITLTSITSTLAFGLGCLSTIPAVYWLCLYAFPTVVFIYLYQVTFFIAWIVLDERRIQHNKRDCCVCITAVKEDPKDAEDEPETKVISDEEPTAQEEDRNDNAETKQPLGNMFDGFMARYAEFLLQPVVKVLVVVAFLALAAICAVSASKLSQQFEFTEVMPDDSYVTDFFYAYEDYTVRNSINPYVYFRYVDQSDPAIQEQMESYVNDLVAMDAVKEQPDFFWLRDFKAFLNDNSDQVGPLTFNQQIDLFLSDPVLYDLYGSHIVRDENGTITTSRVEIYFENVSEEDVNDQIDTLKEQRHVTARQPINQGLKEWKFFTYDGIYNIWEFYTKTQEELILTTITGVVAVTGVALIFIPHWTASLFVLPMICILYVDLLGVMQWANVHVNAVTYITVVMAIGLLVDFIMHVLLRYYECSGNRHERTVDLLKTMGSSILVGGISTFLGTLPLAFSTSTIFFTIFIAFVALVTLGLAHGLILLPVVLSIIGPEDDIPRPKSTFSSKTHNKDKMNMESNSDDMDALDEHEKQLRMTERTLQVTDHVESSTKVPTDEE
ncbi:hypothetical protein ACA910_016211 [Epithemia clementina (nom. ined.)]